MGTRVEMSAVKLMRLLHGYKAQGFEEFHVFMDDGEEYVLLINSTNMHAVRIYANGQVWKKTTGEYVRVKELTDEPFQDS